MAKGVGENLWSNVVDHFPSNQQKYPLASMQKEIIFFQFQY